MIPMNAQQADALRTELDRVWSLAAATKATNDTDATRKGLLAVRMATMNAMSVLNDIEAEIRTGATKEHANV